MTNGCPTSSNPFTDDTFANDLIIQTVASGKYLIFRDGIDSFQCIWKTRRNTNIHVHRRDDKLELSTKAEHNT